MIRLVENFREFLDLAKINQGPDGWTIYGSNPRSLSQVEKVAFPDLGIKSIRAKVDTGADGTSIHANDIKEKNGVLSFWVNSPKDILEFKKFNKIKVKNSSGKTEDRYRIKTQIKIGEESFNIQVSLTNRDKMKFPCILGKNVISQGKYVVDVNKMIESFEVFTESINDTTLDNSIFAWYTSWNKITDFKSIPTWFSSTPEDAEARHKINKDDHTYLVRITGNILSRSEAKSLANDLGINFNELEVSLIVNPSNIEKMELIEPFIEYCDGFIHNDEDPKSWGSGNYVESLIVFDPSRHVEIIKEINY